MTLHHLRHLLSQATPGPWERGTVTIRAAGGCPIVNLADGSFEDAALIAALRNHAELLLDVVEAAVAWRDGLIECVLADRDARANALIDAIAKLEQLK